LILPGKNNATNSEAIPSDKVMVYINIIVNQIDRGDNFGLSIEPLIVPLTEA